MWHKVKRLVWKELYCSILGAIINACVQVRKQAFTASEEWVLIWEDTKDIYRDDNFQVVSLDGWYLQMDKGEDEGCVWRPLQLFPHTSILKLALF